MPQLSATAAFCFGLTILSVGYIAVEIFRGDKYPEALKNVLKKYKNTLFDRIIHYIIWGILINLIVIIVSLRANVIGDIANIFNISGQLAKIFVINGKNGINIQFIIFSISYFLLIVGLMIIAALIWKIYKWISKTKK